MDPITMSAMFAMQMGSSVLGSMNASNQAQAQADAMNQYNDAVYRNQLAMHNWSEAERMGMHNAKVDAYNRFIPMAFDRANLAYQDNNAQLTELIDQYQFAGQDRLAAQVAQQGAMAATGRTGRGAMTTQVAADSALGRGDALMARNLMAARYGTERANLKIQQQLKDDMMNAYNQVAYTPTAAPAPMPMPHVSSAYSSNNMWMDMGAGALQAGASLMPMMGGAPSGGDTGTGNTNPYNQDFVGVGWGDW